jgi:hypothetical protein
MNRWIRFAAGTALALLSATARAESLRCNGQSASVGDSRVSVLQKCGEPLLRDSFCKPVEVLTPWHPYPVILPPQVAPCEQVDEWLYDRGPGNLFATVRFQRGAVEAIRYEGRPR